MAARIAARGIAHLARSCAHNAARARIARQRAYSAWRVRQRVVALAMKCIAAGCINERRIVASANVVMAWHQ
jgi:hypothetical protein